MTALSTAPSSAHATLSPAEKAVFAEAVSRGEALRRHTDDAIAEYGRWLFAQVFGEDSSSAIAHRGEHALWSAIAEAADSTRLRLPLAMLEAAVLCAAYDKRLNSDAWRALDFGRKARLLRLAQDKLLRQGAQHVLAANLSAKATEQYAREVLREQGEPVQVRLSVRRVQRRIADFSQRLTEREFARRFDKLVRDADPEQKRALLAEIEAAQGALAALRARLKQR